MSETIRSAIRSKYASVAAGGLSSDQEGVRAVAQAFGYSAEELAAIPAEANMGVQCGNPTATATLKPGEVVVDLGSGGGLDVFLAARKVGPEGRVIGIDMTPEMIELARRNATRAKDADGKPLANVEFQLATIEEMPLPEGSVDCVISNCVLNLVPDKLRAFREIARVLKPGGRLAASDIALLQPLPAELADDLFAYVGCIAGAIHVDQYRAMLIEAGFRHVEVLPTRADLNAYAKIENQQSCCTPTQAQDSAGCCGGPAEAANTPELLQHMADLLLRYDVNQFAASVQVFAVK